MHKSPFTARKPQDFRILLFYPNLHMSALMPQSIGIFTAILKQEGYTLDLFDCTYYQDIDVINLGKSSEQERVKHRKVLSALSTTELTDKGVKPKWGIKEDFIKKAAQVGIDRITEIGKMGVYDHPWDGMFPLSRFVRWTSVY